MDCPAKTTHIFLVIRQNVKPRSRFLSTQEQNEIERFRELQRVTLSRCQATEIPAKPAPRTAYLEEQEETLKMTVRKIERKKEES